MAIRPIYSWSWFIELLKAFSLSWIVEDAVKFTIVSVVGCPRRPGHILAFVILYAFRNQLYLQLPDPLTSRQFFHHRIASAPSCCGWWPNACLTFPISRVLLLCRCVLSPQSRHDGLPRRWFNLGRPKSQEQLIHQAIPRCSWHKLQRPWFKWIEQRYVGFFTDTAASWSL